jgi:ligand-binding sensor domain-containing protein
LYNTTRDFTTQLAHDSKGAIWVGTWGNGIYRLSGDTFTNYDETNSPLQGIGATGGGATYVVVRDIDFDAQYVYAISYLAVSGYAVAIGDLNNLDDPNAWDSLGVADGITDNRVVSVGAWGQFLAVGTEDNGLFFYSFGNDRNTKNDDSCSHLTENSAFLISNSVRTVRFNSQGELWVGTSFGISRYDAGIERFVDVNLPAGFGPDIVSLAFDVRDNLWAASTNGIARINSTTGEIELFTTQNSGLLSHQINNLTVDLATNDLYVATEVGISVLFSEAELTRQIDNVRAYPNPFVISDATDRIRFNYAGQGTVQVFNEVGDPVISFPVNLPWDGRNSSDNNVASGVYLFIISNETGEVGRGKFLVIRR